jgi:hypothetical protein
MKDMQIARNVNPFVERLDCPIAKRKKTEQEHLLHIFFQQEGRKTYKGVHCVQVSGMLWD